jgi:hypothetical protein
MISRCPPRRNSSPEYAMRHATAKESLRRSITGQKPSSWQTRLRLRSDGRSRDWCVPSIQTEFHTLLVFSMVG